MNFDFNSLHNVQTKLALLLLDWLGVRFDVQTMHGYLWIKSGHVFVVHAKTSIYSLMSTINFSLSVSDKLSLIKMGLG